MMQASIFQELSRSQKVLKMAFFCRESMPITLMATAMATGFFIRISFCIFRQYCRDVYKRQIPSLPYKRPMTKKGFYQKYDYVYDDYNDWIICPNLKTLYYTTTDRRGYRLYQSIPYNCKQCPEAVSYTHLGRAVRTPLGKHPDPGRYV